MSSEESKNKIISLEENLETEAQKSKEYFEKITEANSNI